MITKQSRTIEEQGNSFARCHKILAVLIREILDKLVEDTRDYLCGFRTNKFVSDQTFYNEINYNTFI